MTSTQEDGYLVQHDAEQTTHQSPAQDAAAIMADHEVEAGDELQLHGDPDDELVQLGPQDSEDGVTEEEFAQDDPVPESKVEEAQYQNGLKRAHIRRPSPSAGDTDSVPDDTPSVQDSVLPSPRSIATGISPVPSRLGDSTPPRRPFDLRFQSRLSSSSILSQRIGSPAFLANHSRQSSLASFGFQSASEPDDSAAPWEVIRWHRLSKLTSQAFSEAAKRNFGLPTCLAVTDQIIIGTSRGIVLVFDHYQNHKAIIGAGTQAIECGAVASLAISADHTTIAVGHATGHIFTWETNRHTRPFLHIPPIEDNLAQARSHDGHVQGSQVLHIGFLGFRRTALVSADDRGMAFSHLASRGTGAIGRTVKTTRILGRYPERIVRVTRPTKSSSVLAFSPLPLGNIEQNTDSLGLVAMLTPYLLVIVSTTPVAQTQHKSARPKDVAAHSAMTAALAWFPAIKLKAANAQTSRTKLAYAWSDVLTVLEVHEVAHDKDDGKERPSEVQFVPRSRFKAEEAIVGIQWLSRSVLAVLTITQQLLIIEDMTMTVTDAFDLLQKDLYHADVYSQQLQAVIENLDEEDTSMHGVVADAYHMSFRVFKGRLFLLGHKHIWWGSLTNWADRLLAMMDARDFIGAIRLATNYYIGTGEKVTIGLPDEDALRKNLVTEKLLEMMSASLRYAFGKNKKAGSETLDQAQLMDLAVACVSACLAMDDRDFLFDEVFVWYEDNGAGNLFIDVLEPHILDEKINSLPPTALKVLISHFVKTHTSTKLEEMICLLDPTSMDIDQVTNLCKQNNLYDAYIYVWNNALMDFRGPLQDLLEFIPRPQSSVMQVNVSRTNVDTAYKVFPYMSFVLTGRVYPTGVAMSDYVAAQAKLQVYDFLFSGSDTVSSETDTFPRLRMLLKFDTSSFISVMNEAFEDTFLNGGAQDDTGISAAVLEDNSIYNRDYIVMILLEVMSVGFDRHERIYLDMFIARNLPKYPQYMLLSGTILDETFERLCHSADDDLSDDAQLSLEYLLSVYRPPGLLNLISTLQQARYYRVLKSIFRQENRFADLVQTFLVDPEDRNRIFEVVADCLRSGSLLNAQQRDEVIQVLTNQADDLIDINVAQTAHLIDSVLPEQHQLFVQTQNQLPARQFQYLRALIEPQPSSSPASVHVSPAQLGLYVRLMCQYDGGHVVEYIKTMKEGELELDKVVPAMEENGIIDAAIILLAKEGQVRDAMDRLIRHIKALQAALKGILENAADSPDAVGTNEAIEDLLESVDRYTGVGTWMCQSQSKLLSSSKAAQKLSRKATPGVSLTFEETLWLDLIIAVVGVAQDISPPTDTDEIADNMRSTVQKVFTALLAVTTSSRAVSGSLMASRAGTKLSSASRNDFTFLRILRAFLASAATTSPSLSQLRQVLASIFSAYAYEESILSLSNSMLDKDVFIHVDEAAKLRQMGWRPRGQVCEICRRRVWGPGTGLKVWSMWEKAERMKSERRRMEFANLAEEIDDDGLESRSDNIAKAGDNSGLISGQSAFTSIDDSSTKGKGKGRAKGKAIMPSGSHSKIDGSVSFSFTSSEDEDEYNHQNKSMPADHNQNSRNHSNGEQQPSPLAYNSHESPARTQTQSQTPSTLIVFSCRHIYHRSCLISDGENDTNISTSNRLQAPHLDLNHTNSNATQIPVLSIPSITNVDHAATPPIQCPLCP